MPSLFQAAIKKPGAVAVKQKINAGPRQNNAAKLPAKQQLRATVLTKNDPRVTHAFKKFNEQERDTRGAPSLRRESILLAVNDPHKSSYFSPEK